MGRGGPFSLEEQLLHYINITLDLKTPLVAHRHSLLATMLFVTHQLPRSRSLLTAMLLACCQDTKLHTHETQESSDIVVHDCDPEIANTLHTHGHQPSGDTLE